MQPSGRCSVAAEPLAHILQPARFLAAPQALASPTSRHTRCARSSSSPTCCPPTRPVASRARRARNSRAGKPLHGPAPPAWKVRASCACARSHPRNANCLVFQESMTPSGWPHRTGSSYRQKGLSRQSLQIFSFPFAPRPSLRRESRRPTPGRLLFSASHHARKRKSGPLRSRPSIHRSTAISCWFGVRT